MGARKLRLAVVFGGRSSEHAVSCVSAGSVLDALDRDRYDVVAIGITPQGRWVLCSGDPGELSIRNGELPGVDATGTALVLPGDPTRNALLALDAADAAVDLGFVDVVFPLLHGPYGEDGTIQGLLELAGVPYVGSGVLASAAAMDKEYMKLLLAARGLPVGPYAVVRENQPVGVEVADLGLPVFVKPARGGSSVGISRVERSADLAAALAAAHAHDPKALVEASISGREIECGVLEGEGGGPPEASVPAEIRVRGGHAFYDFDAKYLDDSTDFDVPADLSGAQTEQVRELAVRAFEALGCEGLARVDFFLREDGTFVVNEANTMPGFTPVSMFPRMWTASGLDYPALVERLVRSALARRPGLR